MALSDFKPGRLRRTLAPIVGDVNFLDIIVDTKDTTSETIATAETIESIVIQRGGEGREQAFAPATMDIQFSHEFGVSHTAKHIMVQMPLAVSNALASYLPGPLLAHESNQRYRFVGRVAVQSVDDDGRKPKARFSCASWSSQIQYMTQTPVAPTEGEDVRAYLERAFQAQSSKAYLSIFAWVGRDLKIIGDSTNQYTLSEILERYFIEPGIIISESRDGDLFLTDRPYAEVWGEAWQTSGKVPVARGQALAPAEYSINSERPGLSLDYKYRNPSGTVQVQTINSILEPGDWAVKVEADWSYLQITTALGSSHLDREARGRVLDANTRDMRMPRLKFDLLQLIGSESDYDKRVAKQVMLLETGLPLLIAGDWKTPLQGVQFVAGMTETITADEWTIEVDLVPFEVFTGDAAPPRVEAVTWDQSTRVWNLETRTWNEAYPS